jgi:hypothetical protein
VARAEEDSSITNEGTSTGVSSGTSYAVAHLAGIAALWLGHHGRDPLIAKYGNAKLQDAFEAVLRSAVTTPAGWDTSKWGAGIVDAVKVLEADLPAITVAPESASAIATEAAPPALANNSALQRLTEVTGMDTLVGADVRTAFCGVLSCDDGELDELARIHGPELAYAYAERASPPVAAPEHVGAIAESATAIERADAPGPPLEVAVDPVNEMWRALSDVSALSEMLRKRLGSH